MGVSALWSYAKGKKHQARASLSKVQSVDIRHFASNKENSDDCGEPVSITASATTKTASTIVDLSKNLHIVDAEIHWCLRGQLSQQLQLLCWFRCNVPSHVFWQQNCVSI